MIFCGQCGLQLAPGSTRCPRCGTVIEAADATAGGDLHVDDATVASRAFIVQNQTPPQTPNSQQPLILRGSGDYGYGVQDANGATSRVERVNYGTQMPPTQQQVMGNSYAGYPAGGYPPMQSNSGYPVQNTGNYPPQVPPGYQPGTPYTEVPVQTGASYPPYSGQYFPQQRAANAKGRTTGLILVLLGLLLILSAAVLFAMQQGLIGGTKAGTSGNRGGAAIAVVSQHTYSVTPPSSIYIDHQFRAHVSITISSTS